MPCRTELKPCDGEPCLDDGLDKKVGDAGLTYSKRERSIMQRPTQKAACAASPTPWSKSYVPQHRAIGARVVRQRNVLGRNQGPPFNPPR